jgi:hypothetical protein
MIYAILRPIAWFLMKVLFFHKATGVENKVQSVPQESGVTAILKSKHPELFN